MHKTTVHAPVAAVVRHRIQTDGQGITTLVGFHGCPLQCKWCINAGILQPNTKCTVMTPAMLYEQVKADDLYFQATGGGVTFGGGEPLLYPEFIQEFSKLCSKRWQLCAETSLWVSREKIAMVAPHIDMFYVDCKDTDPAIYRSYTGQDNARTLENLKDLLKLVGPERVTVRLPLIPDYNTEADRQKSLVLLRSWGIKQFDLFTYQK